MILINIGEIPGREYEVIRLVKGSAVRGTVKDILAKWQNFIGGEMKNYTKMLDETRLTATQRMIEEAEKFQATAVISVTYSSAHIMPGAVEILAYGTAVKFIDMGADLDNK